MTPVAIGQPWAERGGVVQVGRLAGQVAARRCRRRRAGRCPGRLRVACGGGWRRPGRAFRPGSSQAWVRTQCLGGGVAFGEEAPGGLPQVLQDVDEVDHDGDLGVAGRASAWMRSIWWVLPSTSDDPGALVVGVAAVGLVEHLADDLGGVGGDAGGQPLAARASARRGRVAWCWPVRA